MMKTRPQGWAETLRMGVNSLYLGSTNFSFMFTCHYLYMYQQLVTSRINNQIRLCPRSGGAVSGQELAPLGLNNGFHDPQMSRLL